MKFNTTIVDEFYEFPNEIREFALRQEFKDSPDGRWPGKRTKFLHELDKDLFQKFCEDIFSIYFDLRYHRIEWTVTTCFQMIEPYSADPKSLKNLGWIHDDGDGSIFSGIVYLTPGIHTNTGTSFYQLTNQNYNHEVDLQTKIKFYQQNIDDEYDRCMADHENNFVQTTKVENVYNRLVSFDSKTFHRADGFHMGSDVRLTQVFFVNDFKIIV